MKLNIKPDSITTSEGCPAKHISPKRELMRSVMCCMLWESTAYESGESIADRIERLSIVCNPKDVYDIAVKARDKMHIRQAPLLMASAMCSTEDGRAMVAKLLEHIIQRPDELTEFCAIYWRSGRKMLPRQVKKGLSAALCKFGEYALAKYNQKNKVKLRDVIRMCHPVPKDSEQSDLWKRVIADQLVTPDTWETALSAGKDKKETFTRLMTEKKLGAMAFMRNLRNMNTSGVDPDLIRSYFIGLDTSMMLPFRFIAAAKYAIGFEQEIDAKLIESASAQPKLSGKTCILIDVSGSMCTPVSANSEMSRADAANGIAMIARESCETVRIYAFSDDIAEIPARHGMALRDAIDSSMPHNSTYLGNALSKVFRNSEGFDRIIVVTDEQSFDRVPDPIGIHAAYMINVSTENNGVGYGPWIHIDGWSESVLDYIRESESESDASVSYT